VSAAGKRAAMTALDVGISSKAFLQYPTEIQLDGWMIISCVQTVVIERRRRPGEELQPPNPSLT